MRAGRFLFEVPPATVARWQRVVNEERVVSAVLVAPGFEPTSTTLEIDEAVDRRLPVELLTAPAGALVIGRVVTVRGEPARGATVIIVDWGPRGEEVESTEVTVDEDGWFQYSLRRRGFVDALARHARHGVAKVSARARDGENRVSLGDLVLEASATIEGTVVGYGRAPLGLQHLWLEPVDESGVFASHEGQTDDQGAFCFACLDATPYRVHVSNVDVPEEQLRVVEPNGSPIEVRVPLASARVTVLGPGGQALPGAELALKLVRADSDGERLVDGPTNVEESEVFAGLFHVTFERPGLYSLAAAWRVDQSRWSANQRVDVHADHHHLTLELAPEPIRRRAVVVLGPDGRPVEDWLVKVLAPETGLTGGSCTSSRNTLWLTDGHWAVSVEPRGDSFVMPFRVELELNSEMEQLELRGVTVGGRLTVRASIETSGRRAPRARLVHDGGATLTVVRLQHGVDIAFPAVIPAGDYKLIGSNPNKRAAPGSAGELEVPVAIRAGELTWTQLHLP